MAAAAAVIPGVGVAAAQFLSVTGVILALTGFILWNNNQDNTPHIPPCPPFPPCPPNPCNNFFSCWWNKTRSAGDLTNAGQPSDTDPVAGETDRSVLSRATDSQNTQTTALILIIVGTVLFLPLVLGLLLL